MRRNLALLLLCVSGAVIGCDTGPRLYATKGRLLKGGQKFESEEQAYIQVTFVPIMSDGKPPRDYYYANVDDLAGTFVAAGKNGKGLPAGKYRVALELKQKKKDLYKGKFDSERSPFVFDIDGNTKEIVIDVDRPPAS